MTDVAMARVEKAVSAAQRRAERIRVGMHSFIATRREIAAAYADRDWVTLGYASFEEYVDSEFSEVRVQLTADERREAVADLRIGGMSQRGIAATLGVSQSTVRDDIAELSTSTQFPEKVTSADGKDRPSSRPAPQPAQTPGLAAAPSTAEVADAGSTSPEPEPEPDAEPERDARPAGPDPEPPAGSQAADLKAKLAHESERRTAIGNLGKVLTYLTSRVLEPAVLARRDYTLAVAEFSAAELRYAAETMAAIAALKEQG